MSLNLFDIRNIDYRYEAKRWIPFKPANTGTRPILFTVLAGDDYCDLNETKLEIKVRMNTSGTGGLSFNETGASDANNTKYVYCVNFFGHSLFNQMNVFQWSVDDRTKQCLSPESLPRNPTEF